MKRWRSFQFQDASPEMPRHIRDLNVYPAQKLKFNKDNRRTDNRENDQKKAQQHVYFARLRIN